MLVGAGVGEGAHLERRIERLPGLLVGHELDGADQSDAARLADQRVILEGLQLLLEMGRDACRIGEGITLLVDLLCLQGDGRAGGMSRIGEAVSEQSDLGALPAQALIDLLVEHHRGDGQVSRRDRLGHGDHVGVQIVGLRSPHVAGAAESADHFVRDEEDVVLLQERLHLVEVGRGRRNDAAGAHHGFGYERRDGLRPFLEDLLLEIVHHARGELLFRLPVFAEAVVVRAIRLHEVGNGHVEAPPALALSPVRLDDATVTP